MKNKEKEGKLQETFWQKNKKIIISVLILLIIIVAIFICIGISSNKNELYDDKKQNEEINKDNEDNKDSSEGKNSEQTIDIQDYVSLEESHDNYKIYDIRLKELYNSKNFIDTVKALDNVFLKYKIDNNNITLKLYNFKEKAYNNYPRYDLSVNNNYVYRDFSVNEVKVISLNNYLIFRYNGGTDIRSLKLYAVTNDGNVDEIYELDPSSKGMRGTEYNISDDGISINGSRVRHNLEIDYNDIDKGGYYSLTTKEGCEHALNDIPDDYLIFALYTYRFENGVLNIEPEVSNKVMFKEFFEKNKICE